MACIAPIVAIDDVPAAAEIADRIANPRWKCEALAGVALAGSQDHDALLVWFSSVVAIAEGAPNIDW